MARDYYTLQPDKIYRVGKHYTPGRAGQKVQFITRHHLMYIGEGEAVVDEIWNHRPASAHHVIGPTGRWVQTVYDNDTAWANASQWANQRTIAIEHSNNSGRARNQGDFHPDSWNISNETIISGARVAAAYCLYFNLGRPVYGKNIRDHFEFTATGCPVHLSGPRAGNGFGGRAGKYHQQWMDEAQRFYDELKSGKTTGKKTTSQKGPLMALSDQEQRELLEKTRTIHHELTHRFQTRVRNQDGNLEPYRDTLVGYVLETDRKVEDMHKNMLPSIWRKLTSKLGKEKK